MPSSRPTEHQPVFSWFRTRDGFVFTSGHAAVDVKALTRSPGDFAHEVRATLENLRTTLADAGSSLDKVVKTTVYITDMGNYAKLNEIYREFFPGPNPPARTCVEVRRLPYNFSVEIEAIAGS
jgi:2-iminobutanoate/2-iminopropanoate deaminase